MPTDPTSSKDPKSKPDWPQYHFSARIGLVLGSGSARGWAHIGIIEALEELGIKPHVIGGCSVGALVGGAYAAGRLQELKDFVLKLDSFSMVRYFDLNFGGSGGMIAGRNLIRLYRELVGETRIEDLPLPFMAVATDIRRGREIWLREGDLASAISASAAIPGLVQPVRIGERWLADGALVNPVPISVARALDADVVIAVNLNNDLFRTRAVPLSAERTVVRAEPAAEDDRLPWTWLDDLANRLPQGTRRSAGRFVRSLTDPADRGPQQLEVMNNAISIMSDRITKSRAVGEPPDLMLCPSLGHLGALQFDKGEEAIAIGRRCVHMMRGALCDLFGIEDHGGQAGVSKPAGPMGEREATPRPEPKPGPGVPV